MAGEEQGRIPFAADLLQERHGRRGVLWIERRRWLVREDHRRVPDQCPSDRHPLLLPHAQAINPDGRVGDSQSREQRIGDRRESLLLRQLLLLTTAGTGTSTTNYNFDK